MTIQHLKTEDYVCITADGIEIDADWNMFEDMAAAGKYLAESLAKMPSVRYGFLQIKQTHWTEVPRT